MDIFTFTLGPLGNNTYLLADPQRGLAAVVDPSFDPQPIIHTAAAKNLRISAIWLTHAHFDHIAGCLDILHAYDPPVSLALHAADLPLWQEKGRARMFGFQLGDLPAPTTPLEHGQILQLGSTALEVRHTPGHCPGHVVFYSCADQVVLCGDLIFQRSVGRTDLPGGSSKQLAESIRAQIYTLPRQVRLLPGHGPETSVGEEIDGNPYV
jgi:glyoxylase-like metal-dependent hydrolase (beta-lactamase superfamily II)